jgi:DNA-binding transcriptional LysR family regulator
MQNYPEIEVQIDLTDRLVNLQEEGYDVVVRIGSLVDSSLIAKRLASDRQLLVASPRYWPRRPEDLARHSCLVLGDCSQWTFTHAGREIPIRVSGRIKSNNGDVLRHAAMEGHGLMRISELRASRYIAGGVLCQVLPEYELASGSAIWALYPKSKHMLPKLRVFLDFLGDWFRDARGGDADQMAPSSASEVRTPARNGKAGELLRARIGTPSPVGAVSRSNGGAR